MQRLQLYLALLLAAALVRPVLAAESAPTGLAVSNEFVRIRVNPGPAEAAALRWIPPAAILPARRMTTSR